MMDKEFDLRAHGFIAAHNRSGFHLLMNYLFNSSRELIRMVDNGQDPEVFLRKGKKVFLKFGNNRLPILLENWELVKEKPFIWLQRNDKVAQVYSQLKSKKSNIYFPANDAEYDRLMSVDVDYDELVEETLKLEKMESRLETFFLERGIQPHSVIYEDLVDKKYETTFGVYNFLGLLDLFVNPVSTRFQKIHVSYPEVYYRARDFFDAKND